MSKVIAKPPRISSFAAPSAADQAQLDAMSADERARLFEKEIAKGLAGRARKVKPQDIVARVKARRKNG